LRSPTSVGEQFLSHGQRLVRGGSITLDRLHLEGLDLTGTDLHGLRLRRSTITGCRFDQANLQMSVWKKVTVTDTSFVRADLREAVLGNGVDDSRFEGVSFAKARMANAGPSGTFVDCDFSKALLTRVEFRDARLVRCRFAGPLRETIFYGKRTLRGHDERLQDVDFSDAEFHFVAFRRLNLSAVRLPAGDSYIVIDDPSCVLPRAIAALRAEPGLDARSWLTMFEHDLEWLGPDQEVSVIALVDYPTEHEGSAERLREVLRAAEAHCR
jgi:hypothetical protein